ncbi:MAG: hypothetical protein WBQ49_05040 [Rhodomicrobium sp.]
MIHTRTHTTLPDAIYAMSLIRRIPDAETLDEFVRRYPEHADALTEFAIELAVDALEHADDPVDPPIDSEAVSPVVSRVMSLFQNRLFDIAAKREPTPGVAKLASSVSPFAALDRQEFRSLALRLDVNTVLLTKLRDRQIEPETIPQGFCRRLAEEMNEDLPVLTAYLCARPEAGPIRQFYKAHGKPNAAIRQSFEAAVRGSSLSEAQQRHLLSYGE